MVYLIIGEKGKGKTKVIHDLANKAVQSAKGSIVYIDKNSKHMYDLHNRIRLIDASRYPLRNGSEFIGFICGIISQDHDLEKLYLDGFLDSAKLNAEEGVKAVSEIAQIGELFGIEIYISLAAKKDQLTDELKERVIVEL